jgi:hypothetical protein
MTTRADVMTIVVLVGAFGALAPVALHGQERAGVQAQCANHLRQVGLAAMMYSDDKRFFPHVVKSRDLDDGYTSNAATKTMRSLLWYAYLDAPAAFICQGTPDQALPIAGAAKADLRRWFWNQDYARVDGEKNPFVDGAPDPTVATTTELSFGWTRRGMNMNIRATALLGADRSRMNHGDGWNVLQADATVTWVGDPAAQATMIATTTEPTSGFLGIQGPDDPAPPGR